MCTLLVPVLFFTGIQSRYQNSLWALLAATCLLRLLPNARAYVTVNCLIVYRVVTWSWLTIDYLSPMTLTYASRCYKGCVDTHMNTHAHTCRA